MIEQAVLELNMQIYLKKMEEKFNQNANKLNKLQETITNAANKIQKMFRRFLMKKKTRAAIKIQRNFRKYVIKIRHKQAIIQQFRRFFASYKIYYFIKSAIFKNEVSVTPKTKFKKPNKNNGYSKLSILQKIKLKSRQFIILESALQSEVSYIRKYMAFDRKSFTQTWQIYEKKQREWVWEQVRKKWVRKGGDIWINQQQKQINTQKYVNGIIEQTYLKHFDKYEAGQKKLLRSELELKNRILGLTKAFYFSVLIQS